MTSTVRVSCVVRAAIHVSGSYVCSFPSSGVGLFTGGSVAYVPIAYCVGTQYVIRYKYQVSVFSTSISIPARVAISHYCMYAYCMYSIPE